MIVQAGGGQALYTPDSAFVRRHALGDDWEVLSVGVMLRQKRSGTWTAPSALSSPPILAFGIGAISDTGVRYGVQTTPSAWSRLSGPLNWWSMTFEVPEFGAISNPNTTLRVSDGGELASAWYLRFTKLDGGGMRLETFMPSDGASPTVDEFIDQLDTEEWQRNIGNHTGYIQNTLEFGGPIATALENIAIVSTAPNYVSEQLRGIEWLAVRAVRMR